MTAADIIRSTSITAVWAGLGGDPPERGRARAFNRDGDNPHAVSFSDAKGCWYDYRDNVGGGVLDLIQHILGCDRRTALRWLSDFTGLPFESRPLTAADRRRYAGAKQEAEQLVAWKERLTDALKRQSRHWWHIYHATLMHVLQHGFDSALGDVMATLHEFAEAEIDRLQRQIDALMPARFEDLLPIFREQKRWCAA